MNISKLRVLIILMLLIVFTVSAFARTYTESVSDKKFDASEVHNLGNIWLRVSNYGFFGSFGEEWPSLEYPGGSSIDYLFAGGLDEAALKSVKQWTFSPAKSGGRPVACWVTFSVNFSLN